MSTFATRMCSSAFSHGVLRETFVRRGSTASIATRSPGASHDGDPVADGRHAAAELVVAELPAGVREPVAALGADVVAAAVLRDDASGLEAPLCIGCEGRLELVGPAEGGQGSIGQRKAPSLGW